MSETLELSPSVPPRSRHQFVPTNVHRRIVAVKIRLKRMGKIRAPHYRIVVADSRTHRDGRVIEEIGRYIPTENPSFIEVNSERAQYWLGVGAQPTEQVTALLKLTGDWGTFKGEKGAKSTVQFKEPKPVFQIDDKKKPVLRPKVEKAAPKVEEAAVEAAEEAVVEAIAEEIVAEAVAEAIVEEVVAEAVAEAVVEEIVEEAVAEVAAEAAAEEAAE
jgi:small subunit ribosomal protein S16